MFLFQTLSKPSLTYSMFRYLSCNLLTLKTQIPTLQHMIDKRFYVLKLYPAETSVLKETLFDYIKRKNGINVGANIAPLSNVFNFESAMKQTYNLVIYSPEPSPKEVIRLFSLYAMSEKTSLHKNFSSKTGSRVLESRVVWSVPFMTGPELHQFSLFLAQLRFAKTKFNKLLKKIVIEESAQRLDSAESLADAFTYLIIVMELHGHNAKSYDIYDRFISVCQKHVESAQPTQLSHLLYFVAMVKHNTCHSDLVLTASKSLHPYFKDVSFTDASLALMGLFKMSMNLEKDVPLSHEAAVKLMDRICTDEAEVRLDLLDSASVISTVKYLRLTSYNNQELLQSIKRFLLKLQDDSFNPAFVCHILALYANCKVYDEVVYSLLENKFLGFLQSPEIKLRVKDISRMMWALAHCQHTCGEIFLKLVVRNLEQLSDTAELFAFPSHVVDATLALAVFKVFPEKLYSALLRPTIMKRVRGKERARYLSRLLILSQVQESIYPALSPPLPSIPAEELPKRTIHDECVHRPCIRRVAKALQWLHRNCGTPVFRIDFLVPHINYCSIALTGEDAPESYLPSEIGRRVQENLSALEGRRIAIDVNDANTCLSGEEQKPVGMEALKRDILRRRGWIVKTLSCADVEGCGDDDVALAAILLQTALDDFK